jgi:capsule polysaccharide export protein KpsE/RkpR
MDELKREKFTAELTAYVTELLDYRVKNGYEDDHAWQNHVLNCIEEIESDIIGCEADIEDLKDDKLSLNALEHEGYLRGLKTALNLIKRHMPKSMEQDNGGIHP